MTKDKERDERLTALLERWREELAYARSYAEDWRREAREARVNHHMVAEGYLPYAENNARISAVSVAALATRIGELEHALAIQPIPERGSR